MPKSTKISLPSSSTNRLPGMHVGVEEAVAQRVAQEGLDHRAGEVLEVEALGFELGAVVQRRAVDPVERQHVLGGAVPVHRRHAEVRDRPWCSPPSRTARRLRAAGPSRSQTERRSVATVSIRRSRRASADSASARRAANVKASRSTRKRCSMSGRSTLTATGLRPSGVSTSARCTCAIEAAATAGPNDGERFAERLAERRGRPPPRPRGAGTAPSCPAGFRDRGPARCRPRPAASPGTGRASRRSGRAWSARRRAGARRRRSVGRSISRASLSAVRAGSGSGAGSTSANTPSRASTKPARARRRDGRGGDHAIRVPGERGDRPRVEQGWISVHLRAARVRGESGAAHHNRQPEWMATMPPVSGWCDTRRKPAARIMSANAAGLGNLRIDSTR